LILFIGEDLRNFISPRGTPGAKRNIFDDYLSNCSMYAKVVGIARKISYLMNYGLDWLKAAAILAIMTKNLILAATTHFGD
jgi:hypothetical protein